MSIHTLRTEITEDALSDGSLVYAVSVYDGDLWLASIDANCEGDARKIEYALAHGMSDLRINDVSTL